MRNRSLLFAFAAISLALPSMAAAGGCDDCTTSAECVAIYGPGSLCVRWTVSSPCASAMQYCCPGQACAIEASGRPSCEGDSTRPCVVVEDLDAGPMQVDAGPGAPDSGPALTDAGVRMDGGSTSPPSSGGCGCRTASGASSAIGLPAMLALLFVRRRGSGR